MSRPGDLYGKPIREASVRGGSGRFSWEDVKKDDKFRDTYIGHSVMAPTGRWQKGRDLQWYNKPSATTADERAREREEELRRVKEAEEEALAEALGFKVERRREGVSQEELARVLKDDEVKVEEGGEGLGFGSVRPRIGAVLADGTVQGGSAMEVDGKAEDEGERRRHHKHRSRRREEDDDERERRKHRHRRRDEDRRRSRSPERERHSHRRERDRDDRSRRDGDRKERDGRRRDREPESRHHRSTRDDSPRRQYREKERRDRNYDDRPRD